MNKTQREAAARLIEGPRTSGVLWGRAVVALLRELLAEPQGEPVAWLKTMYSGTRPMLEVDHLSPPATTSIPVYAHPPQQRKDEL